MPDENKKEENPDEEGEGDKNDEKVEVIPLPINLRNTGDVLRGV